ncbi:MAG: hypothetical protein NTW97_03715 [Candidatus Krumholzibacteria bacterium]|nr:hypothetical protein [Candidatus Krumholzibacteria bacterium]
MKKIFALAFVLAACLAVPAAAQTPPFLSYQGILTDGSGVAVPDDTYSITFSIYNVGSGGSALWTETNNVEVSKGTFSVLLGATAMLSVLPFNETYYIGMSIEDGPELPRQVLTRTPYSFSAKAVSGTGNVIPSSGNAGIGTLTPDVPLTVTSASGQVGIRFDGNDDFYSSIYVNAIKPGASAGYGYETQSGLRAYTFVDSGNNWNLRMAGINYALRASSAGNVSIGALAPATQRLTVDGALQLGNSSGSTTGTIRWTGSDFEGYNGSAWQSFTATGEGPPAGSLGQTLRHDGSEWIAASNLHNDGTNIGIGTSTPEARLHVNGDARIGSSTATGYLSLFRPGIPTAVASLSGYASGGEVATYDEDYNLMCTFKPSFGGEGGMLGVTRNTDQWGLFVDGNFNLGQPSFYLMGDDREVVFDLSQSGDQSVWLPYEAVSSSEISDEPGVASFASEVGVPLTTSVSTVASQSITTPGPGYILVIASSNLMLYHSNGAASHAIIGTSDDASWFADNQDMFVDYPATAATGTYFTPTTCHGLYYNPYSGTYTYYLLGVRGDGAYTCYENQLSLIYLPTAYGTVQPTLAAARSTGQKKMGAVMTSANVAAQKTASEAANAERIRRELDELRAEIDAMKAKLETRTPVKIENR